MGWEEGKEERERERERREGKGGRERRVTKYRVGNIKGWQVIHVQTVGT